MEYKLSKSEFYRIGYLLAGLFMFLFLFGIFNLSSYADILNPINYNFNSLNYNDVDVPAFSYTISGTGHFTYVGAGGSSYFAQQSFYVVTDSGSINIANYCNTFYGTTRQDITFSYSGTCLGKPINAYVINDDLSGGYGVFVWDTVNLSVSVVDWGDYISGNSSSSSSFSDYSSFSPVNIVSSFSTRANVGFTDVTYPSGTLYSFTFPDYSGTVSQFSDSWIYFMNNDSTSYFYFLDFYSLGTVSNLNNINLYVADKNGNYLYSLNNPRIIEVGSPGNLTHYTAIYNFDLSSSGPDFYRIYISGSFPHSLRGVSYNLVSYKATINDYMNYVKDNWDNISPNVTTTNQNIAQSQSDIGTAQTFETGAFTDFDTSMSNSGLDEFSLSFNSTPLFWCASIINTFYNNMPTGFQYLLAFVAFIGILCTVLNVFGRVAQRFGDRDSSSLNKHDVFSKIEKHGSI